MRPTKEETMLNVAQVISERGTCARRKVGCVLVNSLGHILATGYNGVARGLPHCSDRPCSGAGAPSGEKLEACEAIHAEQNALLQCQDTQAIETCYTTVSPCLHCVKLLMNTGCKQIVFLETYPLADKSEALWKSSRGDRVIRSSEDGKYYGLDTWVRYPPMVMIADQLPAEEIVRFKAENKEPQKINFVHPRKFGNLGW